MPSGSSSGARGVTLDLGRGNEGHQSPTSDRGARGRRRGTRARAARPSPAGAAEVSRFEALARERYGVVRRLSLPRSMLSRLLEVLVSLDRAAHLEEQGLDVRVATLFERAIFSEKYRHFCQPIRRAPPFARGDVKRDDSPTTKGRAALTPSW